MNALNPVRTIGSQIVEALETPRHRAKGAAARARTGELLESVGIPAERGERYPHELSGGMRQRAAIAMALACNPKVLIADEPTTALDVMVQAQILELLDGLCRDLGLALILVTHDLPVVAQLCDRGAVMYAGEIVERGPVDALYHAPRHPYTPPAVRRDARSRDRARRGDRLDSRRAAAARPADRPAARSRRAATAPSSRAPSRAAAASSSREGHDAACHLNDLAGAGVSAEPTLLEVDDLVVRYPIARGLVGSAAAPAAPQAVHAVDGVSLSLAAGRDARARRRVGLRQDDDRAGGAAARRSRLGLDPLRRARHHAPRRRASCGRCGAGSRSSTRIRTSRSTRGSACARPSRSRC